MSNHKQSLDLNQRYVVQIEQIDADLAKQNIAIHERPPLALKKFETLQGVKLPTHPPRRMVAEDDSSPEALSIRLYQWYEERYGRRQHKPFAIGHVAVWLQGDWFRLHIPLKMDDKRVHQLLGRYGQLPDGVAPVTQTELLRFVEDMNPKLAQALRATNRRDIFNLTWAFEMGIKAFVPLYYQQDITLLNQAAGDLNAAVFHILKHRPRFGAARWAFLQAVEKSVKAYIRQQASKERIKELLRERPGHYGYSKGHNLTTLYNLAERLDLNRPPQQCIDFVQCDQGVRYGEGAFSIEQMFTTQIHALQLIGGVARATGEWLHRPLPDIPKFTADVRVGGRERNLTLDEVMEMNDPHRQDV